MLTGATLAILKTAALRLGGACEAAEKVCRERWVERRDTDAH